MRNGSAKWCLNENKWHEPPNEKSTAAGADAYDCEIIRSCAACSETVPRESPCSSVFDIQSHIHSIVYEADYIDPWCARRNAWQLRYDVLCRIGASFSLRSPWQWRAFGSCLKSSTTPLKSCKRVHFDHVIQYKLLDESHQFIGWKANKLNGPDRPGKLPCAEPKQDQASLIASVTPSADSGTITTFEPFAAFDEEHSCFMARAPRPRHVPSSSSSSESEIQPPSSPETFDDLRLYKSVQVYDLQQNHAHGRVLA